ncbi:MAG: hypothetical protein IKP81_12055 [Paludibacteraceae bacterium]|nr:hypothetical protein [Paludibacteraceae bacterium]
MRKILGYFILTAAVSTSISLASCSDDDDDDDTVIPVPVDTTKNEPVDTTGNEPVDTTGNEQGNPVSNIQYTLDDIQGTWHTKTEKGCEEYLVIEGEKVHIIRYNTEYPGEDNWISLKLGGAFVDENKVGFSPSYLSNIYGFKLKQVSNSEFVAVPKNEYFANDDYSFSDITYEKVDLPSKFTDPYYIFQLSMNYDK